MIKISFRIEGPIVDMLDALVATGLYGETRRGCAEQLMLDQLKHLIGTPILAPVLRREPPAPLTAAERARMRSGAIAEELSGHEVDVMIETEPPHSLPASEEYIASLPEDEQVRYHYEDDLPPLEPPRLTVNGDEHPGDCDCPHCLPF